MNDIKKGTLIVAVATVITSAMILMTGKSVADNSAGSPSIQGNSLEHSTPKTETSTFTEELVSNQKTDTIKVKNSDIVSTQLPPPGPYLLEKKVNITKRQPVAPMHPAFLTSTIPAQKPQLPLGNIPKNLSAPSIKIESVNVTVKPSAPKNTMIPPTNSSTFGAQQLTTPTPPSDIIKPPSMNVKAPKTVENKIPVWMEKRLQQKEAVIEKVASSISQKSETNNSGVMQQYMYIPMPVYYQQYQMPQMPMYHNPYIQYQPQLNYTRPLSNEAQSQQPAPTFTPNKDSN